MSNEKKPAPAPLPEGLTVAAAIEAMVPCLGLHYGDPMRAALDCSMCALVDICSRIDEAQDRRVEELEAELEEKSARIEKYRNAADEHRLEKCFVDEAKWQYMAECERVRKWAAEVLADALKEAIELAECLFTRAEAAEAKSARLGRKLQRVGLHLCETRKKLRKVEGERDAEREKREAAESALAGEKAAREHDRSVRWAFPKVLEDGSPEDIRAIGWAVAGHNDYKLNGVKHTFWLFTKGDRNVKGEGLTDAEALNEVRAALAAREVKNG